MEIKGTGDNGDPYIPINAEEFIALLTDPEYRKWNGSYQKRIYIRLDKDIDLSEPVDGHEFEARSGAYISIKNVCTISSQNGSKLLCTVPATYEEYPYNFFAFDDPDGRSYSINFSTNTADNYVEFNNLIIIFEMKYQTLKSGYPAALFYSADMYKGVGWRGSFSISKSLIEVHMHEPYQTEQGLETDIRTFLGGGLGLVNCTIQFYGKLYDDLYYTNRGLYTDKCDIRFCNLVFKNYVSDHRKKEWDHNEGSFNLINTSHYFNFNLIYFDEGCEIEGIYYFIVTYSPNYATASFIIYLSSGAQYINSRKNSTYDKYPASCTYPSVIGSYQDKATWDGGGNNVTKVLYENLNTAYLEQNIDTRFSNFTTDPEKYEGVPYIKDAMPTIIKPVSHLYVGENAPSKIYIGNTQIKSVKYGGDTVWNSN